MRDNTVRNVFILSIDSFRYDYFSEYLSGLVEGLDAVEFRNAVATGSSTSSSTPTLHAGVYSDSGLLDGLFLPESSGPETLAQRFEAAGYTTGLWTPNQIFGQKFNYNRGFTYGDQGSFSKKTKLARFMRRHNLDPLFDLSKWVYFNVVKPGMSVVGSEDESLWQDADEIHSAVTDHLETRDGNHLCWIHYMDTHHPFEPPQEYLDEFSFHGEWTRSELSYLTRDAIKRNGKELSGVELSDIETAYRASYAYLADELQRFIRRLSENGTFDPEHDLVCITADHGEAFTPNKHGLMGHFSFFEEVIRVPLVISHPDWERQTINKQVSLIDLMPTLIELAGLEAPETAAGNACHSPEEMVREYTYLIDQDWHRTRRGVRGNGWKLFGHKNGDDEYELVLTEYKDGPSVSETIVFQIDIESGTEPELEPARAKWESLWERLETERGAPIEGKEKSLSSDIEEQLEDLGYM